jgi:hypothetical protein
MMAEAISLLHTRTMRHEMKEVRFPAQLEVTSIKIGPSAMQKN